MWVCEYALNKFLQNNFTEYNISSMDCILALLLLCFIGELINA